MSQSARWTRRGVGGLTKMVISVGRRRERRNHARGTADPATRNFLRWRSVSFPAWYQQRPGADRRGFGIARVNAPLRDCSIFLAPDINHAKFRRLIMRAADICISVYRYGFDDSTSGNVVVWVCGDACFCSAGMWDELLNGQRQMTSLIT